MSLVCLGRPVSIAVAVPEKLLLLYQFFHSSQCGIVRIDIFNLLGRGRVGKTHHASCPITLPCVMRRTRKRETSAVIGNRKSRRLPGIGE